MSPRTAIIAAVCLFTLFVGNSVWTAVAPRTSSSESQDSYGRGREGYRGIVQILETLGLPVERRADPPDTNLPLDATLVLWSPDPRMVTLEPTYLSGIGEWVHRGGRVVVTPGYADFLKQQELDKLQEELEHYNAELLPTLGLDGVSIGWLDYDEIPEDWPEEDPELVLSPVVPQGMSPGGPDVKTLATLGEHLPVVETDANVSTRWTTWLTDANGRQQALAVGVRHGAGEYVIVSDPTLLSNVSLQYGDNSIWGVQLLTDEGRRQVIVDEFYHGLSVRGNPWWLLGQPQYAMPAVALLLLLGLATWRAGLLLGPSLETRDPSRRTIREYLDAMSRFLLKGRSAEVYLLRQLQSGVFLQLGRRYGVSADRSDWDRLILAVQRHDSARAENLRQARKSVDAIAVAYSVKPQRVRTADVVSAMRELSECLIV